MKQYIMLSALLLLSLMTWAQGEDKYKIYKSLGYYLHCIFHDQGEQTL